MISKKKKPMVGMLQLLSAYLLVCSLITAVLSGLLIACYYIPTPAKAALSIAAIQEKVFAGTTVITIHRLSGIFSMLFTLLNVIIILRLKKISESWIRIWQTGIVLIILFIFFSTTGYLLTGSNSAAYLLKSILFKFSNTKSHGVSFPELFSSLPVAFVRVYVLHLVILPLLTGLIVYKHIKGLKQLGNNLQPITLHPIIILAAYITFLIIMSLFLKPAELLILDYTENYLANMPWIIKSIIWVIKTLSLPVAIILSLMILFLILSIGNIIKKYKNQNSHKDTETQREKQN